MSEDDELHEDLKPRDNPEGASKFELDARSWAAREKAGRISWVACEQYGLDPSLAEALEDAHRRDDMDDWLEALADLLEAVAEAEGTE
jgi:hypothetical protein